MLTVLYEDDNIKVTKNSSDEISIKEKKTGTTLRVSVDIGVGMHISAVGCQMGLSTMSGLPIVEVRKR